MLREEWLMHAMGIIGADLFQPNELTIPELTRISVGFPLRGGRKGNRAIGQCWGQAASKDKATEIFICPTLDKPIEVIAVLIHELIHASVGVAAKHGGVFKRAAVSVGLTGKMTETVPSDTLIEAIRPWIDRLGEYPHARLTPDGSPIKKQGTRMIKIECPSCGYAARTTAKWLEVGLPVCPCGDTMVDSSSLGE